MDSEVEELEIKTEIEIEEWKPPDVSGTSNQNPPLHTFKGPMVKLELENLNDFLNTSKGPMIKLEGLYFMISFLFIYIATNFEFQILISVNDDNLVENNEVKQQIKKEPVDEEFIVQNPPLNYSHLNELETTNDFYCFF